ncbi:MAG: TetR/AcrR family transcriptional regulator [Frankiales bacterium]|nr:MAG: TetR/AcrR family transcriptional regulator [Frankiales bacterium]
MTTPRARDTRHKGLTKAMVAGVAEDVLNDSGVERLSMRQVAMRLGVSPTALYNHVESKEDLLALIADSLRARISVDDSEPARNQLLSLLRQLRDLGARHPALLNGGAAVNTSQQAAEVALLELRLLHELGLKPHQVRVAYQQLVMLVTGAAVVWRARAQAPDLPDLLRDRIRAVASTSDIRRLDALDALPSMDPDAAFERAVDQILQAAARYVKPRPQ